MLSYTFHALGLKERKKKQSTKQTLQKLQGRFPGFRDLLKESASRIQEQLITESITWFYEHGIIQEEKKG